jgi:hypothetical protein
VNRLRVSSGAAMGEEGQWVWVCGICIISCIMDEGALIKKSPID